MSASPETTGTSADSGAPLLAVENLSSGYGDLTAVWDVSLAVHPGEVTLVLGRNGVGKTTTLMALAGLLPAFSGSVRLDGEEITSARVQNRAARGLAFVPEGKRIFPGLTVEENLTIGGVLLTRQERKEHMEIVYERFPLLAERRRQRAVGLSGGQQQVLALGQALMGRTRVLMLDEPSAGLAPKIFDDVLNAIRRLASEGVGILLVEQVLDAALPVADRMTLIDRGRDVYTTAQPGSDETKAVVHQHLRGPVEAAA